MTDTASPAATTWIPPSSSPGGPPGEGRTTTSTPAAVPRPTPSGEARPSQAPSESTVGPTPTESSVGVPQVPPDVRVDADGGWSILVVVLVAVAIALLAAAIVGFLVWRRRERERDDADLATAPPASPGQDATVGSYGGAALAPVDLAAVDQLVRRYDLATTDPERARVADELGRAGVLMADVVPGAPIDPLRHNVVSVTSGAGGVPGTVAEVIRPGWQLGDRVIRPADISAYAP